MKSTQKYEISIDIGGTKISGIAYKKERNGHIKIFSKQTLNSKGFKSGNIVNMDDAENSVMSVIYALESECKTNFSSADISISGCGIKSYYVDQKIKIDSSVNQENINNLINLAIKKFDIPEYELIHSFPIEFTVDNNVVENPLNIYCKELGCKLHIVVAEKHKLRNVVDCLLKCNIQVNRFISNVYASGLSCLSPDIRKFGGIIFDLGSHTSSFGIFLNNKLIYTNTIPIGGYYITSDISKALSIDFSLAEKIKVIYGKVNPGNLWNQFLNFSNLNKNRKEEIDLHLTLGDLSQIITPRIHEIVEMIKSKYDELDIGYIVSKNIYITGGGSNLDGIDGAFRDYFEYQVNKAKPILNNRSEKSNYDAQDSVLIGMMLCSQEEQINNIVNKSKIQKFLKWLQNHI
jgi:cell division protein FtsA